MARPHSAAWVRYVTNKPSTDLQVVDDLWPVLLQLAGEERPARRRAPGRPVELVIGLASCVVLAAGALTASSMQEHEAPAPLPAVTDSR